MFTQSAFFFFFFVSQRYIPQRYVPQRYNYAAHGRHFIIKQNKKWMLLFIAHGLLGFCLDALAFKKVPAVRIVQSTLMLWLSKVYGIPVGMYASQVWGTVYLSEGSEFGSQLQKRHLCSLRRILGVKNSTTNWAVLRGRGQEPLQFFWFRASNRFFNSMLDSNRETLRRVLKADLYLTSFDSSCWSAQVSNAFNGSIVPTARRFETHFDGACVSLFASELESFLSAEVKRALVRSK